MEQLVECTHAHDTHETAIVHEEREDSDVIHVFGECTYVERQRLENAIVRSVRIGRRTICNLLGVSYLDAAGVGVLLRAREALGSAFSIVAPQDGMVARVLDLCEVTLG